MYLIRSELLTEMKRQDITPSELACRLKTSPQTVNRIIKLDHPTKIETLIAAFNAIGKTLSFTITDKNS